MLAQASGISANPDAFAPEDISFTGTAESIVISSGADQFGWDDLTLNIDGVATNIPEPSSLPLLLAGLGLVGGAFYFGRKKVVAAKA